MRAKDSRDLKRKYKRMLIFLAIIFVVELVLCYLLMMAGLSNVLCGVIIVLSASIFYLLFLWICAKIDKKRAERLEKEATKDPFTKN